MKVVLLVLALLVVVATALPLARERYWWIRVFDFPRMQLAIGGVVTLALFVAFYQRVTWVDHALVVLLVLSVGYQVWRMWPYTVLHPKQTAHAEQVRGGRSFRFAVSNVLMENRESERWLRVIRGATPDLVLAVETDAWWAEHTTVLEEDLPHTVKLPQDNTYGLLLFSRWPLHDIEMRRLVEEDVPSVWGAVELPSGDRVRFVFVHPRPPRPDIAQGSYVRDAELVLVAEEVQGWEGPVFVAGDLNDVAWSHTTNLFQSISGLLDPRIGRGLFSTFHADYPVLRWPLDHIFHSDDLQLVELELLENVGSDHFPILIELAYQPEGEDEQEEPDADAEDRRHAEEALEDAAEMKAEETPEEKHERQQEDR